MEIYLHTIDGALKGIVLNPSLDEQDTMASNCDDRENYSHFDSKLSQVHPELLVHIANAYLQLIKKGENWYSIPKKEVV